MKLFLLCAVVLSSNAIPTQAANDSETEATHALFGPWQCKEMMPEAAKHCRDAISAADSKASALDSDADINNVIRQVCAAPTLDPSIEQSCKDAVESRLVENFDCDNGGIFTSNGRAVAKACKTGKTAGKQLDLKQVDGYSDAKQKVDAAAKASCPTTNRFVNADCLGAAAAAFEARVGSCSDTPLHVNTTTEREDPANHQSFSACYPGTYKVAGGNYSVRLEAVDEDSHAVNIAKVERADGSSFQPKFSPPFKSTSLDGIRTSPYPQCTEVLFEKDGIVCLNGGGYRGTASVAKDATSSPTSTGSHNSDPNAARAQ